MNSLRKCESCCCCCTDNEENSCRIACCLDDEDSRNKCITVHHSCLGFVFPRLIGKVVEKTDRKPVLLIARRRVPKGVCHRIQVYTYLSIMACLTGLWFIVTLLEQVIYHNATSCNELDSDDMYYICFDYKRNWSIIDCQNFMRNYTASTSILCYTYSITPSAIGIAFTVASFVSTIISITFHSALYCSDEQCSRRGLIVVQILFILGIILCAVSLGVLYTTEERISLTVYFFDEKAPLRGVSFILFGVSLLFGSCLPWGPFHSKRRYETVAMEQP